MNLAILIGISKYTRPVTDLPACVNDLDLIHKLIRKTGRFSEIIELSSDTSSATVKTEIAQFLAKHREQTVNEIFFYYTGHGDLYQNDFYFLFSDFTESRRNQTSLSNEELDSMIRPLNPKLTIKVVDACHAGITYVKEADALSKQLYSTTGRLKDCYFMFSSQSSQPSMQDDHLSDFTEAFLHACSNFPGKEIRYKDIVDHISDAFTENTEQTPTFVIQASCTEVFCTINSEIKNLMSQSGFSPDQTRSKDESISAIAQAIKTMASDFCTKEEVQSYLIGFEDHLKNTIFSNDLKGLYDLTVETQSYYDGIPSIGTIGRWLENKTNDYFAKPTGFTSSGRLFVTGIECTSDVPYKSIKITASPIVQNLLHGIAFIVFVFSKRELVLFYNFQSVTEVDWGHLAEIGEGTWKYRTLMMKKDITGKSLAIETIGQFESFLTKIAQEKLGLKQEDAGEKDGVPSTPEEKAKEENEKKTGE